MKTIEGILTEKLHWIKGATEGTVPEDFYTVEATISELPVTVTNSAITAKHRVVECSVFDAGAQAGPWTWETGDGMFIITGELGRATAFKAVLAKPTAIIGGG